MLKRKKLLEETSDHFDPENTYKTVWNDLSELQRDVRIKDRENLEHEMEMLLDRIEKLSELLDKAKVGILDSNFTGQTLPP